VLKDKDAKQLKIIDFGTAQDLTITPNAKAMVGTPEFIGKDEQVWRNQFQFQISSRLSLSLCVCVEVAPHYSLLSSISAQGSH